MKVTYSRASGGHFHHARESGDNGIQIKAICGFEPSGGKLGMFRIGGSRGQWASVNHYLQPHNKLCGKCHAILLGEGVEMP